MIPAIVLVGRPNVGKSTLFNCLTNSQTALVADQPGLTRDRQYGQGQRGEAPYLVIDCGGIAEFEHAIDQHMAHQTQLAITESDAVIFLVDARAGLTAADQVIADLLRRSHKLVFVAVNKVDGLIAEQALADFYHLGFKQVLPIAAAHHRGISALMTQVMSHFPVTDEIIHHEPGIKFAIVGRPNVGKSTLVNRILGEERLIVVDQPGTTRDAISIPFERHGKTYTIVDTAGVRKRGRIKEKVEKFSVIKTLQTIESVHVVVYLFDSTEGITDQDLNLIGFTLEAGRSMVLAFNKWDGLSSSQKQHLKRQLSHRLQFADFLTIRMISALHGTGVGELFPAIEQAYQAANKPLSTPILTEVLLKAIADHPLPMIKGRRIKLRYAHAGGHNPPLIIIYGNQTASIPGSYQRYLINYFRKALTLPGTPIKLVFKTSVNPYRHRRNKLTPRQQRKRKRLFKHAKR